MELIVPVVLAGGTGSRLWPLSRSSRPKQLLNILGENTLLQETLLRCNKISSVSPLIIYNKEYHYQVAEQTKKMELNNATFICEPLAKNTAPAVALAAMEAKRLYGDCYLFVMPADHFIRYKTESDLALTLTYATLLASQNYLVTFGIVPSSSESGFGYIRQGQSLLEGKAFTVDAFVEKPSKEKAEEYLKQGNYLWNSGMFFFGANDYLNELQLHAQETFNHCRQSHAVSKKIDGVLYVDPSFEKSLSISVDYAVMEHSKAVSVIPLDAVWSDVGSWSSIFNLKTKDEAGNVIEGDVITHDSTHCYIKSSSRLVAAVGLDNHILIETSDSVLVAHQSRSQDIKQIVDKLNQEKRVEASLHYKVFRPWGCFEILTDTPNYKVKRLTVNVGCSLSLQKHKFRSEHWVVVSGVATIINGEEHLILYP
jgi:mannose-1-phosphate guanylyltransferase/mannose-6-phosphate isomerase